MPELENIKNIVTALNRVLTSYNRNWGYFKSGTPIEEQKWFKQFSRLAVLLLEAGVTPIQFIRVAPYRPGNFFPSRLMTELSQKAVERAKTVARAKKQDNTRGESMESDREFLALMVKESGQCVLYLVNFFWEELSPETQQLFEPFHNEYFLRCEL
jgi:hypothetical protein